ncbi:MAG: MFS transporter [Oligoflexales bacterium]|nr:MFS transporter [Oligoflexales bacterium]
MFKGTKNIREVISWALFDVANSSYTTIIITVAYTVIFSQLIVGTTAELGSTADFSRGNFFWALFLAISHFLSAVISPLIGAISDVAVGKKKMLIFSVAVCSTACFLLYFVDPGMILVAGILLVVSNLAFNLTENIISSFLPHIIEQKHIPALSGLGWGLGYLGGLAAILLCFQITGLKYNMENYDVLRWIGPITGCFFIVFSLPTLLFLREVKINSEQNNAESSSKFAILKASYSQLSLTLKKLPLFKDLAWLLLSFFFFQGGLVIVISFASLYGMQVVGITGIWQMIFFVSLQLTACLGALFFAWLQRLFGMLKSLNLTLVIWIATILAIGFLDEISDFLNYPNKKMLFIIMGNFAGLCIGATQSLVRSLVGVFSPPALAGEFFGFWGFFGKLAAVFALVSYGTLQKFLDLKSSLFFCTIFFVIGLLINLKIDEKRGIRQTKMT